MEIEDVGSAGSERSKSEAAYSDVLVIVPAYNEATMIDTVVTDLMTKFPNVLVVDDGSSDGTSHVARSAGARVARHLLNLGQGGALRTGFRIAAELPEFKWVVTFDADGQHQVGDAKRMIDTGRERDLDVVLGTRFGEGTSDANRRKRWMLKLATAYTRLSTGLKVTDSHNGLRAMTQQTAASMTIEDRGMGHASDILDYIALHRLRWLEIPVHITYTDYSQGKGQSMINAVNILFDRWVR